jgi:uncharacterized protein (TIGR02466 family)
MSTLQLFPTKIYKTSLVKANKKKLLVALLNEIEVLAEDDIAGLEWSQKHYSQGYTSYASANQMQLTSPTFSELEKMIRVHVFKYLKQLKLNVSASTLKMNTCWVNIMGPHCTHPLHIHPHSVISGTFYVQVPKDASAIRFEDPRYSLFMNRPPTKTNQAEQTHYSLQTKAGDLVLFESWLRHDVPLNEAEMPRISISFNYG